MHLKRFSFRIGVACSHPHSAFHTYGFSFFI
jgi:hypothetical protein